MKLIKPSFEILEQSSGEEGIYKQIERIGRICYKSEDKITEDSYKKFVEMLKNRQHGAMLEHGTVYLKDKDSGTSQLEKYKHNKYSVYFDKYTGKNQWGNDTSYIYDYYVTTNFRALVENGWLNDLKYLCEPTEYHEKRVTVKFICDRGVSHEFIRHRVFSFAQESTRYCNYSKDKFNNEITFIQPSWCENIEESKWDVRNITPEMIVHDSLIRAERNYNLLIKEGWKPQQARQVLPNALKTELVMTGFVSDWKHFFELRDDKDHAHPDAYTLAHPLHEEFIKRGYL